MPYKIEDRVFRNITPVTTLEEAIKLKEEYRKVRTYIYWQSGIILVLMVAASISLSFGNNGRQPLYPLGGLVFIGIATTITLWYVREALKRRVRNITPDKHG
jgi:hypothetical protein